MRIAFVTPEYPNCGPSFGIGAYVARLAQDFTDHGHAVLVIVVSASGWWVGHSDHVQRIRPLHCPGVLRPWMSQGWVTRTLDELAPDIVEIPNWGGLGAFLPKQWPLVTRLSTSIQQMAVENTISRHLRHRHARLECASVKRADVVIANSHTIALACAPLYRRMADYIIPHAFSLPTEPTIPQGNDVLFVGRLEHRKGIDVLLRAWPIVSSAFPQATLHVVGLDRHHLANKLPPALTARVRLHGHLEPDQLNALRNKTSIQVIPSRFESFGLTVIEAFAHGQVVVAADCPGLVETVNNAGFTYPVEDPQALAQALLHTLKDSELRQTCRQLGKIELNTRFAPKICREATLAAYQDARIRARRPITALTPN